MTPELQAQADAAIAAEAAKNKEEVKSVVPPIVKDDGVVKPVSLEPTEVKKEITVASVGNDKIDSIGQLLASRGVDNAQAIMTEFEKTGELSVSSQADLVEGLGADIAKVAIGQLQEASKAIQVEVKAERTRVLSYAEKVFGTEGTQDAQLTWDQMQEFARSPESGLTTADLKAMNVMLAKGGISADLVVDKVASIYRNQPDVTTPADLLHGDSYSSGAFEPMTKADYVSKLNEAERKFGYNSVQVDQINRRRELSISRGY